IGDFPFMLSLVEAFIGFFSRITSFTIFVRGVRCFFMPEQRASASAFLYPRRFSCPQELPDIDETMKVLLILAVPFLFYARRRNRD
ncbi:MAG: hypothetical protein Q7J56_03445, partial [Deltaproteobacteria bacterium]|nr:hypothetical protein [Deltaproteobacteria bacterium]